MSRERIPMKLKAETMRLSWCWLPETYGSTEHEAANELQECKFAEVPAY